MIDFKQIEQDYPKACRRFDVYMHKTSLGSVNTTQIDGRYYHDLECFFDDNGVYVSIEVDGDLDYWWKTLSTEDLSKYDYYPDNRSGSLKSRTYAKETAFEKAFEILEKQLTEEIK